MIPIICFDLHYCLQSSESIDIYARSHVHMHLSMCQIPYECEGKNPCACEGNRMRACHAPET